MGNIVKIPSSKELELVDGKFPTVVNVTGTWNLL